MFNKKLLLPAAVLISGVLHSVSAQGLQSHGPESMNKYVDFSAKSPFSDHQSFGTWSIGTSNPGTTKFTMIVLMGKSAGSCFVVKTLPASASETVTDLVAYTPDLPFRKIDDDGPNSGKMPYFKVFAYHDTAFRISAKNDTHNNRDWNMSITEYSANSPAACKALINSTIPMYDYTNDVVSPGPTTAN
ncbi:MAG TPA: hypothetical protein VJ385_14410 [Fibrobacteria bacterium]|nr:hypothetical protein [Fibrobacteria bacterium]